MPTKTLDEYLKQTTHTTTKQQATKPKYRIIGFYKETEFQETPIGKIPKQWNISRLEHLATAIYYGVTAKAVEHNTGLKMLRTTDIKDYKVDWDSLPYCEITSKVNDIKKYLLRKGDLIVARAGTVGVSVLVDRNFDNIVFGSYLIKVRPKENLVYPKFLHYYFQNKRYWKHIRKAQGSTLKNINLGILKFLLVPIPPLEEQWGIAEVLSALDRAIEATGRLIGRLERLKRGLMQELLTRGIGHKEFKETPIGKIPKEWRIVKLSEVSKIDTKPVMPRPGVKYYYLGLEDIESETGRILKPGNMLTDGSEIKSIKYVFTSRHILYGRLRPYLNKVALPDRDGICSTDLLPVLPEENLVLREYLAYVLRGERFVKYASDRMKGTNHPRISQKDILMYIFSLPPIDEQKVIVKILNSIDEWIMFEIKRKEKFERLKRGLMELLLTGRVRVRVERINEAEDSSGSSGVAGR